MDPSISSSLLFRDPWFVEMVTYGTRVRRIHYKRLIQKYSVTWLTDCQLDGQRGLSFSLRTFVVGSLVAHDQTVDSTSAGRLAALRRQTWPSRPPVRRTRAGPGRAGHARARRLVPRVRLAREHARSPSERPTRRLVDLADPRRGQCLIL